MRRTLCQGRGIRANRKRQRRIARGPQLSREGPVYYYSATAHAQIDLLVSQLAVRSHRTNSIGFRVPQGDSPAPPRRPQPTTFGVSIPSSSASGELSLFLSPPPPPLSLSERSSALRKRERAATPPARLSRGLRERSIKIACPLFTPCAFYSLLPG